MSEYVVELDGKHSIALKLAFIEEACGGDFIRGEIVRCRDCKRVSVDEFGGGWCGENCRDVKPWDFCAWGERREQ